MERGRIKIFYMSCIINFSRSISSLQIRLVPATGASTAWVAQAALPQHHKHNQTREITHIIIINAKYLYFIVYYF